MPDVTIALPKLHSGQRKIAAGERRFNILVCGRRFGKTEYIKRKMIRCLIEGKPVGYFVSRYMYLSEVWASVTRTLSPLIKYKNASSHRLELVTGGVLDMWTLSNPDAGRSRKYALAVIDEASLQPDLADIWYTAIRPTLLDYQGAMFVAGTPKGINDFHKLYVQAGDDPEWSRWQCPTHENPYIPQAELDALRKTMPALRYRQEILAEFIDDNAGVFRYVNRAVYGTMAALSELDPHRDYVIGVDLGKLHDYTVFVVLDRDLKRVIYYERMQSDYTVQLDKLMSLCNRLRVSSLVIETNTGQMFIEQVRAAGRQVSEFTTTAKSKQPLIETLAVAFERGDITIPDDDILLDELMSFEAERLPSGAMRYAAPNGYHDDVVMALALAWHAVTSTVVFDTSREVVRW